MPLVQPVEYSVFKMIGIDPGLNNTGIAIFDVDYHSRRMLSIEAFTLCNDRLANPTPFDVEFFSERTVKLYKLKSAIQNVLYAVNPCVVACESPFYNRLRPMAYGSLLEVLGTIHTSILDYNQNIQFQTLEPLMVKKTVGAGFMSGKVDVKLSVARRPEIMSVLRNHIDTLDEHSIDAIAIGYTFLVKVNHDVNYSRTI